MHPFLFKLHLPWGVLRVPTYGVSIVCGFLLALWLLRRRSRRLGMNPDDLMDLAVYSLFAGVLGARLFYVVQFWSHFKDNPIAILRIDQGGLVFYGGMLAGLAATVYVLATRKLPVLSTLDTLASVVPLAHAFGRFGCFMNGCCYGHRTQSWLGLRFPKVLDAKGQIIGSPPYQEHLEENLVSLADNFSKAVHPTQLYAVAYHMAIFGVLTFVFRKRHRPGTVAVCYLFLYPIARFSNEFLRVTPSLAGDLSVAQVISLLLLGGGIGLAFWVRSLDMEPVQPQEPPEEPAGNEE